MARQIKCAHCGNWNSDADKTCTSCHKSPREIPLLETQIEKNNYQQFAARLKAQSGWLDRFFENAKNGNVFMKSLAYFLQALWMVYFSLLLFIAWLVFIVAG
ncbi:MAG TPA: hypothetical protein VD905_18050 [Flavobacteriales bacterium]|nr:hypothetical protein [Flavobacteriales bacterium]